MCKEEAHAGAVFLCCDVWGEEFVLEFFGDSGALVTDLDKGVFWGELFESNGDGACGGAGFNGIDHD